jgi:hypothetical protein
MIEIRLIFSCDNCHRKSNPITVKKMASRRWAREAIRAQGWASHKPAGKGAKLIDLCPECRDQSVIGSSGNRYSLPVTKPAS